MKFPIFAFILCMFSAVFAIAQNSEIDIIPKPRSVKPGEGNFELSRKTKLVVKNADDRILADFFNDQI